MEKNYQKIEKERKILKGEMEKEEKKDEKLQFLTTCGSKSFFYAISF